MSFLWLKYVYVGVDVCIYNIFSFLVCLQTKKNVIFLALLWSQEPCFTPMAAPWFIVFGSGCQTQAPALTLVFLQCRPHSLEIGWCHQTNFQAIRKDFSGLPSGAISISCFSASQEGNGSISLVDTTMPCKEIQLQKGVSLFLAGVYFSPLWQQLISSSGVNEIRALSAQQSQTGFVSNAGTLKVFILQRSFKDTTWVHQQSCFTCLRCYPGDSRGILEKYIL